MHELGHVLGCDHVAGTIMREDLAPFIASASPFDLTPNEVENYAQRIDQSRELFFSPDRGVSAIHAIILDPMDAQKELFRKLFKREIAGPLWMGFQQGDPPDNARGLLSIADETGETLPRPALHVPPQVEGGQGYYQTRKLKGGTFPVKFDLGSKIDFSSSDNKVFRVVSGRREFSFSVPGFLLPGQLTVDRTTGDTIPFTYARNRGADEYVRLIFGSSHGSQDFFRAYLFGQPYW